VDTRSVALTARNASRAQQRSSEPLLVSVEEAAVMLGIGRTLCYELVITGQLESVMIKGRRLVVVASIHEFVERLRGR
jgi:excisionase family DNA binding protein